MVARGEMTQEEAEERLEEIGRRFQEKLTREAILDMMESGHLTMEESEVELRVRIKRKKKQQDPNKKKPKRKMEETRHDCPVHGQGKHAKSQADSTWRE